jgi:hypothetical protein
MGDSYNDDDLISGWKNQIAGGGTATASGSDRPVYKTGIQNGNPITRWDGVDDIMDTGTVITADDFTAFFVVNTETGGMLLGQPNDGSGRSFELKNGGNYVMRISSNGTSFTTITSGASTNTGVWEVITFEKNGTSATIRVDGTSVASGTVPATINNLTVQSLIGARADHGESFEGDIAEIILYDSSLSSGNRSSIESYLSTKWGT